jgi:hypothetical protein
MKKWFVLMLIVCVAGAVQAGEGKKKEGGDKDKVTTKESYVAWKKADAEKKGVEFDQAAAEAHFDKRDKNGDGKLTGDEKGKKEGKKKKAE